MSKIQMEMERYHTKSFQLCFARASFDAIDTNKDGIISRVKCLTRAMKDFLLYSINHLCEDEL